MTSKHICMIVHISVSVQSFAQASLHVKPTIVIQLKHVYNTCIATYPYTGATWSCSTLEMEMPFMVHCKCVWNMERTQSRTGVTQRSTKMELNCTVWHICYSGWLHGWWLVLYDTANVQTPDCIWDVLGEWHNGLGCHCKVNFINSHILSSLAIQMLWQGYTLNFSKPMSMNSMLHTYMYFLELDLRGRYDVHSMSK